MEFGKWELRNDSSYYFAKDAQIWPSSNALDEGKLTTEENLRNIYRDLTTRNFVLKYNYFNLTMNASRNGVIVSPGEAVIQGYHFYTKNSVEVKVPDNRIHNENGSISAGPIVQYTLGISLSYDAANHVTGDIVNKEGNVGESEMLSGVYLKWFDECELECYYDNILVLGRAWVQNAAIVKDGTTVEGRIIYHGFEQDPFKDHKYNADVVEVEIHGHSTTIYDTLRDNMTQIHAPLYTYDSMHYPVELDRCDRTKAPSFVTDIQDYVNHVPDWYVSKYGDYMTGALRFNNLSIDAMREYMSNPNGTDLFIKDGLNNKYQDGVIISPRTYGDLTRLDSDTVASELDPITGKQVGLDFDYNVGGTIMSIVPGTYPNTTDNNNGYTGTHSALVAQRYGDTGLRIHTGEGNETSPSNYTRLVHYNNNDSGRIYKKEKTDAINTSKFIIENVDDENRHISIDLKNGEMFFDAYNLPNKIDFEETSLTDDEFKGTYKGSGFQFYVGDITSKEKDTPIITNNIDFRIDSTEISLARHIFNNHRTATRGNQHLGLTTDNLYVNLGVGISYDLPTLNNDDIEFGDELQWTKYSVSRKVNTDPYFELGNLRVRSNSIGSGRLIAKQNTIEVINKGDDLNSLPYVRVKPRVYSEQYLAESVIQLGVRKNDDFIGNEAQTDTLNKIIMKKVNPFNDNSNSYTYLEQDYKLSTGITYDYSKVFNKWLPPINNIDINSSKPSYEEIAGMYSAGNIGCSTGWMNPGDKSTSPYQNDKEWVRFTRFRYDNDKDKIFGGTFTGSHDDTNGRKWGDTYNIEFNTNVSNRRANQLIWRYNGSQGSSIHSNGSENLKNTPPVVLSYIHDNTSEGGTPTKYTNYNDISNPGYDNGKGTYESYIDHLGYTHQNPTNKIRDFLLLENAGLHVSGDINNPAINGDSLNTNNHLGVTIIAGRVYNSVYNDFAETFEKDDKTDFAKPGTLISLNPETGKYRITDKYEDNLVVGVVSNTYAFLAGGNRITNQQDIIELENEYYAVALCGKVWVNVTSTSIIKPGDMLVSSLEKGKATNSTYDTRGTIIGKALCSPKYFEEDDEYKVLMLVMTA